ncbi:short-chain dehydrogenase/reductase SDR [Dunaliella salina]|uniref:Short-chain dehydrogenase/reductase SDR n=1 Tax=Dunaliella salina TaxID=3046 RepID=A0ABQ7GZX6_DUNSA|nr:short-chain dehydrogenase/reductase SDR [Dunaliella salina]|eukprot:KAF5840163.1 short-chain dehydrogenase/reductase SDR [Dunaliella salina]
MIPERKEDSARNRALDALPDAITKLTSHDPAHPPPQVAIITGGDSGIGRSVAIYFAKEGCKGITIARLAKKEEHDAQETARAVEAEGAQCLDIVADVSEEEFYHPSIMDIPNEQIDRTFAVNVFANFYLTQAAIPHMKEGASIIITTSMASVLGCHYMAEWSKFSPMKRVGQPCEVAPCYVFLASDDSSFFSGKYLPHPGALELYAAQNPPDPD